MKEFLAAHNAEYCTYRLSYPDQRNTTEFTTHSTCEGANESLNDACGYW
jgi:hypothetical protein